MGSTKPSGTAGAKMTFVIAAFLWGVVLIFGGSVVYAAEGTPNPTSANENKCEPKCDSVAAETHAKTIKIAVPSEISAVSDKIAELLKEVVPILKGTPIADIEGEVEAKIYKACCCPQSCDAPVDADEYSGSVVLNIGAQVIDGFSKSINYSSAGSTLLPSYSVKADLTLGPGVKIANVAKVSISGETIGTAADAQEACSDGPSECGSCLVFTGSDGIAVTVFIDAKASGSASVFQGGHWYSVSLSTTIEAEVDASAPGSIGLSYYTGGKCNKQGFQDVTASFGPLDASVILKFSALGYNFDPSFTYEIIPKQQAS